MATSATQKVSDAIHEATDQAAEGVEKVERRARKVAGDVKEGVRDSASRARERSGDFVNDIKDYVEEHPIQALGLAFLGGIVFSSFLRR
jgi:ElaB/YqjD/DUF883 family membrane-anchored ribosome-binding protein